LFAFLHRSPPPLHPTPHIPTPLFPHTIPPHPRTPIYMSFICILYVPQIPPIPHPTAPSQNSHWHYVLCILSTSPTTLYPQKGPGPNRSRAQCAQMSSASMGPNGPGPMGPNGPRPQRATNELFATYLLATHKYIYINDYIYIYIIYNMGPGP